MQYFEDIELDQPLKGGTYELTESEIVEFAKKWDPFPIHIDKEAAELSMHGWTDRIGPASKLCYVSVRP